MKYHLWFFLLLSCAPAFGHDLGLAAAYCEKALDRYLADKSDETEIRAYLSDTCSAAEFSEYLDYLKKISMLDDLEAVAFVERVRRLGMCNRIFLLALVYARLDYLQVYLDLSGIGKGDLVATASTPQKCREFILSTMEKIQLGHEYVASTKTVPKKGPFSKALFVDLEIKKISCRNCGHYHSNWCV